MNDFTISLNKETTNFIITLAKEMKITPEELIARLMKDTAITYSKFKVAKKPVN